MAQDTARQALAEAIAKHDAAVADLERLQSLTGKVQERRMEAFGRQERAQTLLEESRTSNPRGYLESLLANDEPDTGVLADAADAELRNAKRDYALARDADDELKRQIRTAENHVAWLRARRDECRAEVVKGAPEAAELVREYDEARAVVVSHLRALSELSKRGCLPFEFNFLVAVNRPMPGVPQDVAGEWSAALTALEYDADAPLPKVK
jgi:hypothetical protein